VAVIYRSSVAPLSFVWDQRRPFDSFHGGEVASRAVYYPMKTKEPKTPTMDQEEAQVSAVPPRQNPKNAAGSLNPKEKNAFYEAVLRKPGKGKPR
jgi:hypothetical protein